MSKRNVDWILVAQMCCALIAAIEAPNGWGQTVFFALLFVGLTCGPEYPWGAKANGHPTEGARP